MTLLQRESESYTTGRTSKEPGTMRRPNARAVPLADSQALDRAAFEELYKTYLPKVFNYVSYRIGDRELAEDITSAVFELALKHLDKYQKNRGAFSTWLFAITRNTIITHLRQTARQPRIESLDKLPPIAVNASSPEDAAVEAEEFRQARQAISLLPELDQELLALKFGSGLGNQEIAEVLRLKPNHIGVMIYRSVQKVRAAIEKGQVKDE